MMPGRPSTRCTASSCWVPATPEVTRQSPRMPSSTHAAAPGWPSTWRYAEPCARRPKMIIAARTPLMIASGRNRNGLLNRMPTSSITPATATNQISMIQGSLASFLRVSE
jgi:hypothetical protein